MSVPLIDNTGPAQALDQTFATQRAAPPSPPPLPDVPMHPLAPGRAGMSFAEEAARLPAEPRWSPEAAANHYGRVGTLAASIRRETVELNRKIQGLDPFLPAERKQYEVQKLVRESRAKMIPAALELTALGHRALRQAPHYSRDAVLVREGLNAPPSLQTVVATAHPRLLQRLAAECVAHPRAELAGCLLHTVLNRGDDLPEETRTAIARALKAAPIDTEERRQIKGQLRAMRDTGLMARLTVDQATLGLTEPVMRMIVDREKDAAVVDE